MSHQVLTTVFLLIIPLLPFVLLAQDSQPQQKVHEVLIHRYGETVEWTVTGGVITYWKPVVVKGQTRAPSIPKPTPNQISTWTQEAPPAPIEVVLPQAVVQAADSAPDPNWRALIAAICLMTECEDEDAAWAAFLAALP